MSSWFEVVKGRELGQGDVLLSCPVPFLPAYYPPDVSSVSFDSPLTVQGELEVRNVVVLSQSCDLINRKLSSVIVGPVSPLEELPDLMNNQALRSEAKNFRSVCDYIREGHSPRFHLLDRCEIEGHERDYLVVDFCSVFTVPLGFLEAFADYSSPRLRLVSPYTEHLSQAFARFVMRVGLPSPIPSFKK